MTHPAPPARWALAQVKPNGMASAVINLRRQGLDCFVPTHAETRRLRGRFVSEQRPLFPGYLFVLVGDAPLTWRCVNNSLGISRLVSFGSEPATVPAAIIDELRRRCDAEGRLQPPPFAVGSVVEIQSGPFADFVSRIEEIAPDRRVWLLLDIMGTQTRISVPCDHLRIA